MPTPCRLGHSRGAAVADALLHQAGVLGFRSGEELFDASVFLESQPLPSGREIGIASNSPRLATLGANACAAWGPEVGQPGQVRNPLVLGIGAGRIRRDPSVAADSTGHIAVITPDELPGSLRPVRCASAAPRPPHLRTAN